MDEVRVEAEIAAPADVVYDLVADMPRMGEWSPECARVEWTNGATGPAAGVRFKGHNRRGWHRWSTHGTVTVADRGRELSFEVRSVLNLPVALWSYRFDPTTTGSCRVVESTEDRRGRLISLLGLLATGVTDRGQRNRETMILTLERLRAAAEATVRSSTIA